jgi:hypothetical protein
MSAYIFQLVALLLANTLFPPNAYFNKLDRNWKRSLLRTIVFLAISLLSTLSDTHWALSAFSALVVFFTTFILDTKSHENTATYSWNMGVQLLGVSLVFVIGCYSSLQSTVSGLIGQYDFDLQILSTILAFMICLTPANIFIQTVLGYLSIKSSAIQAKDGLEKEGLAKAGRTIGILERCITLTFILMNQYEAIGLLIAAKSLIRFKEDPARSEYIIIGNLLSFGIAIFVGVVLKLSFN